MSEALSSVSRNVNYDIQIFSYIENLRKGNKLYNLAVKIFTFLSEKDIYRIKSVSHQFKRISSSPSIWKEILIRNGINLNGIKSNFYELLFIQSEKRRKMFLEEVLKNNHITWTAIPKFVQQLLKYKTLDELQEISSRTRQSRDEAHLYLQLGKGLLSINREIATQFFDKAEIWYAADADKRDNFFSLISLYTVSTDPIEANKIALKIKSSDKRNSALVDILIRSCSHETLELNMGQAQNIIFVDKRQTWSEPAKVSSRYGKAYELAHQIGDPNKRAYTLIRIGQALMSIDSQAANQCLSEARVLADKMNAHSNKDYILLALVRAKIIRYPQEEEVEDMANQIKERDLKELSFAEIYKARINHNLEQSDEHYNKALKLVESPYLRADILSEFIRIKASTDAQKAKEIARCIDSSNDDPVLIAYAYAKCGEVWTSIDAKQAAHYFSKALEVIDRRGRPLTASKDHRLLVLLSLCFIDGSIFSL